MKQTEEVLTMSIDKNAIKQFVNDILIFFQF